MWSAFTLCLFEDVSKQELGLDSLINTAFFSRNMQTKYALIYKIDAYVFEQLDIEQIVYKSVLKLRGRYML